MDRGTRRSLVARAVAIAGVVATVFALFATPAHAAASIDAKPPHASIVSVPSRGPITISLTASATYAPGTAHAFASFLICGSLAPCVAVTATPTGGPEHWDAQKTETLDLVAANVYTVEAIWEGSGLAWTGVTGHSSKTSFVVPRFNDNIKDNLKSAFYAAVATAVLSCGAILVADALLVPFGAAATLWLGRICEGSAVTAVGAGVPLLFDPPDSDYPKVALPRPELPPVTAPPTCDPSNATCAELVARLATYAKALGENLNLWAALARTTNRMTTAGQAGDFASVSLQLSSSRVLFGMISDAIEAERTAAGQLAQSLTAHGYQLTLTDAQVNTLLSDGSWITDKLPEAQPALRGMGLDQTAVLDMLRQGRQLGAAALPNANDLPTTLNLPSPVAEMRRWSAGLTAADLEAVVQALAATGDVRSTVNGPLTAALQTGCVDETSKQHELAIVSGVSDSYLKQFLTSGIQAQSGQPPQSGCPGATGGSTTTSPTTAATRPKVTPVAGSLIRGGGFEAGDGIPDERDQGYATLPATGPVTGSTSGALGPWRIVAGCLDLVSDGPTALDGVQFIDLNGNCGISGTIEQTAQTIKGHRYEVTVALAGNAYGDPAVKTVRVSCGTAAQEFSFDTTGHRPDDLGWANHTFVVTADSTATVLRFTSLTTGIRGPLLDHVSIVDLGGADAGHGLLLLWILLGLLVLIAAIVVVVVLRRRSVKHQ